LAAWLELPTVSAQTFRGKRPWGLPPEQRAMSSRALKGTASASALKIAASMTLKGADGTSGAGTLKDLVTVKMPPDAPGNNSIDTTWDATMRRNPRTVSTVWDEATHPTAQGRQLEFLAGKVDRIGSVFEGETRSRNQQRQLVDELHEDQMKRLDEIGLEIDQSIADLTAYMDDFIRNSRGELVGTFDGLHEELRARIDGLLPRLKELEARGWAVRLGLEEERAARIRETAEILVPFREQVAKLAADLQREQRVRETRSSEIQRRLDEAVAALDSALDSEIASRGQRVAATGQEWRHEREQLSRRQDKLEQGLEAVKDALREEIRLEAEQRAGAQDPVVRALTAFIRKFQTNATEQSHLN